MQSTKSLPQNSKSLFFFSNLLSILILTLFCFSSNSNADYFSDDVFYSSFDFTSVNPNAKGYSGIVSDGNRYLYYVPYNNGTQFHGNLVRYDSYASSFTMQNSFSFYDFSFTSGLKTIGYHGAVLDPIHSFIYFVPFCLSPGQYHARILRLDLSSNFDSTSSYSAIDAGNKMPVNKSVGYAGGCYANSYVYFAPYYNGALHGNVMRISTNSNFSLSSVHVFNASFINGQNTVGYSGCVFDGRYITYVPFSTSNILRFDTFANFQLEPSWSAVNVALYTSLRPLVNFADGISLNGSIFFASFLTIQMKFNSTNLASTLQFFDTSNYVTSVNTSYVGIVYNNGYLYYPSLNSGPFARYDVNSDFSNSSSWSFHTPSNIGGFNTSGYYRGACLGRFCYFAPFSTPRNYSIYHGVALRLDCNFATASTVDDNTNVQTISADPITGITDVSETTVQPTPVPTPVPSPKQTSVQPTPSSTTNAPSSTSIPTTNNLGIGSSSAANSGYTEIIIGVVLGVVVICLFFIVLIVIIIRRRKRTSTIVGKISSNDIDLKEKDKDQTNNYQSTSLVMNEQYANRPIVGGSTTNQYEKVSVVGAEKQSSIYANSSINSEDEDKLKSKQSSIYANTDLTQSQGTEKHNSIYANAGITEKNQGAQYANSPMYQ